MESLQVAFVHTDRAHPYVQEAFEFECDGLDGFLEFNGYYYVDDGVEEPRFGRCLPKEETIIVTRRLDVPPRIWRAYEPSFLKDANGVNPLVEMEISEYRIDQCGYRIVVSRREKIYNTDVLSRIEDNGGEEMDVCFFPTDKQRIHFRVVEILQDEKNTTAVHRRQLGPCVELSVPFQDNNA
jgi:hypothetical protein